ncbi:MAG: hypothetical protein RLZ29_1525 [Actinomycetota bacterium]
MLFDESAIDMAEPVLRFDALAQRWDFSLVPLDEWLTTEQVTDSLQVARSRSGAVVGFIFDVDRDAPSFDASVREIEALFGPDLTAQVISVPRVDIAIEMPQVGPLVTRIDDDTEAMRPALRLQRTTSDVVILDDKVAAVVTVTMSVPWWARFVRPWVAVRRRGRRDILLTGPLRIRGRTARATLRYGMPYPGSTLTADVVKGPRDRRWVSVIAAVLAAVVAALGVATWEDDILSTSVVVPPTTEATDLTTSTTTTTASLSITTIASTTTTTSTTSSTTTTSTVAIVPATTAPPPVIEVQPSRECRGEFCVLSVEFGRGTTCMQPGDTFTQFGDGFSPDIGLPLVYFIPGVVRPQLPGGPVLRVPVSVVSPTEIRGIVPAASDFAFPPIPGQAVSIVVSNGAYGPSAWGSSWHPWCG